MKPDNATTLRRCLLSQIALLWAGAVIGGSLIAAPAKFQIEELTMPVALLVGRAQFSAVAIAELILIVAAVASEVFSRLRGLQTHRWPRVLFAIAIGIYAVQHLAMMPQLHARSLRVIAGETVSENGLHLVYVVFECLKILLLLTVGFQRNFGVSLEKR